MVNCIDEQNNCTLNKSLRPRKKECIPSALPEEYTDSVNGGTIGREVMCFCCRAATLDTCQFGYVVFCLWSGSEMSLFQWAKPIQPKAHTEVNNHDVH